MKKMVLVSIGVAVLLFTGCSQKNPNVDMTTKNQKIEKVNNASPNGANTNGMNSNDMNANNMNANNMAQNNENTVKYLIADLEQKLSPVYFNFDKYNIKPDMVAVVQNDATILNSDIAQKLSIKIEGNCDEWGSDEYNYALGLRRAKKVKDEFGVLGIDTNRMMIISYGKSNPVCTEHTRACWAKNRRADFKLLP